MVRNFRKVQKTDPWPWEQGHWDLNLSEIFSRLIYGINLKILRHLILKLLRSQTQVLSPPARTFNRVTAMTTPHHPPFYGWGKNKETHFVFDGRNTFFKKGTGPSEEIRYWIFGRRMFWSNMDAAQQYWLVPFMMHQMSSAGKGSRLFHYKVILLQQMQYCLTEICKPFPEKDLYLSFCTDRGPQKHQCKPLMQAF